MSQKFERTFTCIETDSPTKQLNGKWLSECLSQVKTVLKQIWQCCSTVSATMYPLPIPSSCYSLHTNTYAYKFKFISLILNNNLPLLYICRKNYVVYFFQCSIQMIWVWIAVVDRYFSFICTAYVCVSSSFQCYMKGFISMYFMKDITQICTIALVKSWCSFLNRTIVQRRR